jgi:hypothetical protein
MSTRRSRVVDRSYDESVRLQRSWEPVREVPWEQIDEVRNRELALVRRDSPESLEQALSRRDEPRDALGSDDDEGYYVVRRTRRYSNYPREPKDTDYERQQIRQAYDSDGDDDRALRKYRGERRRSQDSAQSQHRSRRSSIRPRKESKDENDDCSRSQKPRKDESFLERNTNSSYNGLLAAGAGALIGMAVARAYTPEEKHRKRDLYVGAFAGAAVLNVRPQNCLVLPFDGMLMMRIGCYGQVSGLPGETEGA